MLQKCVMPFFGQLLETRNRHLQCSNSFFPDRLALLSHVLFGRMRILRDGLVPYTQQGSSLTYVYNAAQLAGKYAKVIKMSGKESVAVPPRSRTRVVALKEGYEAALKEEAKQALARGDERRAERKSGGGEKLGEEQGGAAQQANGSCMVGGAGGPVQSVEAAQKNRESPGSGDEDPRGDHPTSSELASFRLLLSDKKALAERVQQALHEQANQEAEWANLRQAQWTAAQKRDPDNFPKKIERVGTVVMASASDGGVRTVDHPTPEMLKNPQLLAMKNFEFNPVLPNSLYLMTRDDFHAAGYPALCALNVIGLGKGICCEQTFHSPPPHDVTTSSR